MAFNNNVISSRLNQLPQQSFDAGYNRMQSGINESMEESAQDFMNKRLNGWGYGEWDGSNPIRDAIKTMKILTALDKMPKELLEAQGPDPKNGRYDPSHMVYYPDGIYGRTPEQRRKDEIAELQRRAFYEYGENPELQRRAFDEYDEIPYSDHPYSLGKPKFW